MACRYLLLHLWHTLQVSVLRKHTPSLAVPPHSCEVHSQWWTYTCTMVESQVLSDQVDHMWHPGPSPFEQHCFVVRVVTCCPLLADALVAFSPRLSPTLCGARAAPSVAALRRFRSGRQAVRVLAAAAGDGTPALAAKLKDDMKIAMKSKVGRAHLQPRDLHRCSLLQHCLSSSLLWCICTLFAGYAAC